MCELWLDQDKTNSVKKPSRLPEIWSGSDVIGLRSHFIGWVDFMALITYSRALLGCRNHWWWKLQLCSTKAWTGICTTQAARNVPYQGPLLPCCLITPKEISTAVSGCLVEMAIVAKLCVYVCTYMYMHRYGCCTCTYICTYMGTYFAHLSFLPISL